MKTFILFIELISLVLPGVSFSFDVDARTNCFPSFDNNESGSLNIWLCNYTYGGVYDNWTNFDVNSKFSFDSENNRYSIEYVFYENDFFAPYINGIDYISFGDNLAEETIGRLSANNITKHPNSSYFHVNKTGTFRISISSEIENLDIEDLPLVWNDSSKYVIEYISNNTEQFEPLGNFNIFLSGNFNNNQLDDNEHLLIFNKDTKAYELEVGLYASDFFSIYCPSFGYINPPLDDWGINNLSNNNIVKGPNNNFVAKKDGTYKICLFFTVEYLLNKSFTWSKDGKSTIDYVSSSISDFTCTGTEDIVVVGQIGNKTIAQASSSYHFIFNEIEKRYSINIDLKKGDYVCFFMKKKGSYIYGFQSDSYSDGMIKSAGLGKYTSSGRQHFLVNFDGNYDFVISGNVENLSFPTDTWKLHGGSYIKFNGDESSFCYVLAENMTSKSTFVYSDAKYSTIQQFGPSGMDIPNIQCFKIGNASVLRIQFDEKYTDSVSINIELDNKLFDYNIELIPNHAYYINDLSKANNIEGEACTYLSMVFEKTSQLFSRSINMNMYKDLNSEDCEQISKAYSKLADNTKAVVNEAKVFCIRDGENIEAKYSHLHKTIIQNLDNRNQILLFLTYLFICLSIIPILAVGLLSLKRQNINIRHL